MACTFGAVPGPAEVLRFRHFLSFRENAEGLNKGRNVGKIDGIFGGGSMFKLAGAVAKHVK